MVDILYIELANGTINQLVTGREATHCTTRMWGRFGGYPPINIQKAMEIHRKGYLQMMGFPYLG